VAAPHTNPGGKVIFFDIVKGLLEKKNYLKSMLLFMRVSFKILVKISSMLYTARGF